MVGLSALFPSLFPLCYLLFFFMHFILSSCGRAALRRSPPRPHLLIFALTKLILFLHTTLPIHTPYISPLPTDYVGGDLETQTFGIPYSNTWQATKVASEATAFNLSKQHKTAQKYAKKTANRIGFFPNTDAL